MTSDHAFRDYAKRHVLVLGLGSFGGGVGAVQFLAARGAVITIVDRRPAVALEDAITSLANVPIAQWQLGEDARADLSGIELLVINPAIRRDHPLVRAALARGIAVTSELNLFWQHQRGDILAVTGSNGKSTTTSLLHTILRQANSHARLGGNIGGSLLREVEHIAPHDPVVLELSSFQLTDLDRLKASPRSAIITNFSANHLDWHDTLEHYRWAKQTMLRWQHPGDVAVLNADDPDVVTWPTRGRRLLFGLSDHGAEGTFLRGATAVWRWNDREETFPIREWLKLPGRHNLANALAATAAALAWGATWVHVQAGLETYEPLPHRLQFVAEVAGRKFYNDSLATTPESAIVGLQSFAEPVVLLAGGYDKHVDLNEMAAAIARGVKAVALMGQTGPVLHDLIHHAGPAAVILSAPCADFRAAFDWAWEQSAPGDVILLSPGCASYDWFRNFADRGQQFTQRVHELSPKSPLLQSPRPRLGGEG